MQRPEALAKPAPKYFLLCNVRSLTRRSKSWKPSEEPSNRFSVGEKKKNMLRTFLHSQLKNGVGSAHRLCSASMDALRSCPGLILDNHSRCLFLKSFWKRNFHLRGCWNFRPMNDSVTQVQLKVYTWLVKKFTGQFWSPVPAMWFPTVFSSKPTAAWTV